MTLGGGISCQNKKKIKVKVKNSPESLVSFLSWEWFLLLEDRMMSEVEIEEIEKELDPEGGKRRLFRCFGGRKMASVGWIRSV